MVNITNNHREIHSFVAAELYMALVTSKEAHANIVSVAPSRALHMAGVVDYINSADLFSKVERTDEIFATKEVSHFLGFPNLKTLCFFGYHCL